MATHIVTHSKGSVPPASSFGVSVHRKKLQARIERALRNGDKWFELELELYVLDWTTPARIFKPWWQINVGGFGMGRA